MVNRISKEQNHNTEVSGPRLIGGGVSDQTKCNLCLVQFPDFLQLQIGWNFNSKPNLYVMVMNAFNRFKGRVLDHRP